LRVCAHVPRFYFRVRDRWGEAPDGEGMELPDLEAARRHAIAGARSLMSDSVLAGVLDFGACVEVEDERGEVVMHITFRDSISMVE
jgi:uncharacterized protein DUF6894